MPTVFSKNCDRLLEGDIAAAFVAAVLTLPEVSRPLSEHLSVDGTQNHVWAKLAKIPTAQQLES